MKKFFIKIGRYSFSELNENLKEVLRKEVILNFPEIYAFRKRFYFQIPPSHMFVARVNKVIAGQRYLTTKVRAIDGKRYKIAGIGISINPQFQGKGIGQQLTESILNFSKKNKYDIVMATTVNPIAKYILKKAGFVEFKRGITYKDVETKKIERDRYGVFIRDFQNGEIVGRINIKGDPVYMGIGAW